MPGFWYQPSYDDLVGYAYDVLMHKINNRQLKSFR
jgi:hypothetical protein